MLLLRSSLRSSLRSLLRHKRFASLSTALLGGGIGFAVALASLADAILFRPLPVPDPASIVRVYSASKLHSMGYVSYPDYEDFARVAKTATGIVAQTQILAAVATGAGEVPRMRMGLAVSANYFDVLNITPAQGRRFAAADAHAPAVILSDSLWRSAYRANPSIIGNTIEIRKLSYTVIGIAPPDFGLDRFLREEFYVPIEAYGARLPEGNPLGDRSRRFLAVYARSSLSPAIVQQELNAIAQALALTSPQSNRGQRALVLAEADARRKENGSLPAVAAVLLALAALVFLASCASVSGLMLLRMQDRARETALRQALGAGCAQLLTETLAETLILSLAGLFTGLLVARAALAALEHWATLPGDVPMAVASRLDPRMFGLAAALALSAAFLCGLFPQFASAPAASFRVTHASRATSILVSAQLALAVLLVGTAVSLFSQMGVLRGIPLGYRTDHVLVMSFDPAQVGLDQQRGREFYRELVSRAAQLPGVRRAALAQNIPLGPTGAQKQLRLIGASVGHTESMGAWANTISPDYFEFMQMPLLAGRDFSPNDAPEGPRVVIVNEALARLWPGGAAIGRTIEVNGVPAQVVGIVRNAKYLQINEAPRPFIYVPFSQNYVSHMTLQLETVRAPETLARAALAEVHAIDPTQPVTGVRPFEQNVTEGALFGVRVGMALAAAAASVALALALAGVFAAVAEALRKRSREIGIRLAIGATATNVFQLGLVFGAKLCAWGCAGGLTILLFAQNSLSKIFLTQPTQGLSLTPMVVVLGVVISSLAACAIPASKLARTAPAIALRKTE